MFCDGKRSLKMLVEINLVATKRIFLGYPLMFTKVAEFH